MRKKTPLKVKLRSNKTALLILYMLNLLDFREGKKLLPFAEKVAQKISVLKKRFKAKKSPVIYVNDSFGKWQSDWKKIYEMCTEEACLGKNIALKMRPEDDDYFVLKPKHSGFYSTNLETLLQFLKIENLVIVGIAGNICVLFTVNDAYMRDYHVTVPKDCTASNTLADNRFMLKQLKNVFNIPVVLSRDIQL